MPCLPSSFLGAASGLSWRDVLWGYERGMTGWLGVVLYAGAYVASRPYGPLERELAGLDKSATYRVGELLRELAAAESPSEGIDAREKWLYLLLLWLFENRANVPDPLGEVELIYADFDYPVEIERFVRYMPSREGDDPSHYSTAEEKMFAAWERYLRTAEGKLGIGRPE